MTYPLLRQTIALATSSVEIFVPDPEIIRTCFASGEISNPYWSQVWPSSIALADHILGEENSFRNRSVLELGAGLGLPSLVAARLARQVTCSDIQPAAMEIAALSAQIHQLHNFSTAVLDWAQRPLPPADILLLSDVNYQPGGFGAIRDLIEYFLHRGTIVVLATPQRLLARDFISNIAQHSSRNTDCKVTTDGKIIHVNVLVFEPHNPAILPGTT